MRVREVVVGGRRELVHILGASAPMLVGMRDRGQPIGLQGFQVAKGALLGQLQVRSDLAQGGVPAGFEEGEYGLAPGVHDTQSTSISTPVLKYDRAAVRLTPMRGSLVLLVSAFMAMAATPAQAADVAWEQWQSVPGVFDLDGPRSDGSLVAAGRAALYLVDPNGNKAPADFARGPGGYHEDPGAEAYMAVSPGGHVEAAGCDFTPDEVFLLRVHVPIGVTRVDAPGQEVGSFANVTGVTSLTGLAFDTTGSFDHRLLVTGQASGKSVITAIDCNGKVQVITRSAPVLEGGLAVAPPYAPNGKVSLIAKPALPIGADIGVESVGFVPGGFMSRSGAVYYADRATPGSPHPGTDNLLRLSSADLAAAGVQDGDLLAATEGGATLVAVHCDATCKVLPVVAKPTKAHGEGHIAFTMAPLPPSPTPIRPAATTGLSLPANVVLFVGLWGIPAAAFLLLVALLAAVGAQALRRR